MINIIRQASTLLILGAGITFILTVGGIDLSGGAVAGLSGMLTASFLAQMNIPTVLGVFLGVLVGVAIGLINGLIISKVHIAPFIVTLATQTTATGAMLIYCGGRAITGIPADAQFLGRGYVGFVPVPVIFMLFVLCTLWVILSSTKFGRHIFAIGGNEECARLSGVKVDFTKTIVYAIGGACAALSGIILTMRVASGQPTMGEGLELEAITASVLGGTRMSGGKGYMLGTVLGCIFMTMLSNGLNIMGVSSFWKQVLTGFILVLAVVAYRK
ncbi:MAG: ABC transporter permease [Oscillospiraceae bacterium]|nr:ABC transporter permease [Oscillospiraceae bacterium]